MLKFFSKKKLKHLIVMALALLILPTFYSAYVISKQKFWTILDSPEYAKVDPDKPLASQTREIEIAGRYFRIPLMYFSSKPDPGIHQKDGVLLRVVWPSMQSEYEAKYRSKAANANLHDTGNILIESAIVRPSLDTQISNREHYLTKLEYAGKIDGLEKYIFYLGKPEKLVLWSYVFLAKSNDGAITNYIECIHSPSARFPGCEHKFIDKGLIYNISYNEKSFFSTWKEQRERTIKFVHNFEITPHP